MSDRQTQQHLILDFASRLSMKMSLRIIYTNEFYHFFFADFISLSFSVFQLDRSIASGHYRCFQITNSRQHIK